MTKLIARYQLGAVAREVMIAMAPAQREHIEQEYIAALAEVQNGPAKDQGVTLGQQAARANLDRRVDDGIVAGPWPPQQGPVTEPGVRRHSFRSRSRGRLASASVAR